MRRVMLIFLASLCICLYLVHRSDRLAAQSDTVSTQQVSRGS